MAKNLRCMLLLIVILISIMFGCAFAEATLLSDLRAAVTKFTASLAKNPSYQGTTTAMGVRGAADPFFNYESYAAGGQAKVTITASPSNALSSTDTDYDGIPNWYEGMANQGGYKMNYLIYEPQTVSDYDGDGCTNYEEYYNYKQIYKCAENTGGICPTNESTVDIVRCGELETENLPTIATINGFNYSTSLSSMSYLKQTNVTLTHAYGNITFNGANFLDINLSLMNMGQDYIYADINRWPGFNRSAIVALKNMSSSVFGTGATPIVMRDGSLCGSHCTNKVWDSAAGTLTFTVDGFPDTNITGKSYYALANASASGITINDEDHDGVPDSWNSISTYCNSNLGILTRCIDNCPPVELHDDMGVPYTPDYSNANQSNLDGDATDTDISSCDYVQSCTFISSGGDLCDLDRDDDGRDRVFIDCDDLDPNKGALESETANVILCADEMDNDCDGLFDGFDTGGSNPDRCSDYNPPVSGQDYDGDGISDLNESSLYHTNYKKADTDRDGLSDFVEAVLCASKGYNATNPDIDGDGLTDGQEDPNGNCIIDGCDESNVTSGKTDGRTHDYRKWWWNHRNHPRGLCEVCIHHGHYGGSHYGHCRHNRHWETKCAITTLCMKSADSNGDGIYDNDSIEMDLDGADIDFDDDGLNNTQELSLGTNMSLYDTDFDGLSDYEEEYDYPACDPLDNDTGNMGMTDGMKITMGLHCGATASADCDGDGLTDAVDPIVGTEANITIEGIPNIEVTVGGDTNLNQDFTGVEEVNITNTTDVIMSAEYDFTEDVCKMTFTQSTVAVSTSSDKYGWAMVSGVLQCGATKTLFIPANAGTKRVCIKDAEVDSISDVTDSCTGSSEVFFDNCDGSGQSVTYTGYDDNNMTYNCTYLQDEAKYMIDGLHHSAGMETTNSRLNISDDTDTIVKYPLATVYFYANYSNRTNGDFIGSNSCNITIDNGATWHNMTQGTSLYTYSTTYPAPGTYYFNVSCNATDIGYDAINLQDSVYITSNAPVPEFSTMTTLIALGIVLAGFFVIRNRKPDFR